MGNTSDHIKDKISGMRSSFQSNSVFPDIEVFQGWEEIVVVSSGNSAGRDQEDFTSCLVP